MLDNDTWVFLFCFDGAGDMAQSLRSLAAPTGDCSLAPRTDMAAHNHLLTLV